MAKQRKINSIEAINPQTGRISTWTHGASEYTLKLIKLEGLLVTKVNGRRVTVKEKNNDR